MFLFCQNSHVPKSFFLVQTEACFLSVQFCSAAWSSEPYLIGLHPEQLWAPAGAQDPGRVSRGALGSQQLQAPVVCRGGRSYRVEPQGFRIPAAATEEGVFEVQGVKPFSCPPTPQVPLDDILCKDIKTLIWWKGTPLALSPEPTAAGTLESP